ncbi:acyl carrier protein [Candidatus Dependentiae bacterium]|nr:acyl carrier protein [Candidatus Dependentiae bacterium]
MTFDRGDTYNEVVAVVAEKLNTDKNATAKASTFENLGADSLDMVEIILELESKFGIEIDDVDAEQLTDINQVVDYIQLKRTK